MGKAISIYIPDDVIENFELVENKSQLISNLLGQYFSEGKEALQNKIIQLEGELRILQTKLQNIEEQEKAKLAKQEAQEAKELEEKRLEDEALNKGILELLEKNNLSPYLFFELRQARKGNVVSIPQYLEVLKQKHGTRDAPTEEHNKFIEQMQQKNIDYINKLVMELLE